MDRRSPSEQGFTLIEVIAAVMIISLVAVTFLPLITSSIQRIKEAGRRMQELYALRSEMERAISSEQSSAVEQELTVRGPGSFRRTVKGKVIKVGHLVTFIRSR
jgi:prepilin-type N-terminal cleavage/methylation domain-containing protein